jgi:hypothetical protein
MKSNELRIGNLVMYSNGNILFKVIGISEFGIDIENKVEKTYIEYDEFEPILLTKEWLLNLGFKKDVDGSFMKNDISIFLDKRFKTNLFLQENQDNFKWFSYEYKIQYVHQLQNLYFALTGDELIFKQQDHELTR